VTAGVGFAAVRRAVVLPLLVLAGVPGWLMAGAGSASAQVGERIVAFDVRIEIEHDGDIRVAERIAYDFGSNERHGIFRDVPTRLQADATHDRVYPLDVLSVEATDASADYEVTREGIYTRIRIGDPDQVVTGRHDYTIVYRIEHALNGFRDHDELYWNLTGNAWLVPIEAVTARVDGPARVERVACYQGSAGSTEPCEASSRGRAATFRATRTLFAGEGVTAVVALPKGAVPEPIRLLEERWSLERAFRTDGARVPAAAGLGLLLVGGVVALGWSRGRDRRFRGSPIDQVMGGDPRAGDERVEPFQADASAPVEFAPPDDLRPGQIGTLIDEQVNPLDVTATIVDLAVRGYLVIHEIPKQGWFGKPDWRLLQLDGPPDGLMQFERTLLAGLFRDGSEVTVSSLRTTFVERLHKVQEALYRDAMAAKWFRARPDKVRTLWTALGILAILAAAGAWVALVAFTTWGWLGLPLLVGAVVLALVARRMPARTARGTAMLRRTRGFRTVIATAETHMSRWAEQENVFTRYLPYAVVFGLTDKWAKAFEGLADPAQTTFYVSSRPFVAHEFASAIDGFTVTTGGTLATAPAASGSSGFSGGGFSGGGGGGGGGGSW
jgi:uncharacterized protein (TIGR04222 family)